MQEDNSQYFIRLRGKTRGPFSVQQLRQMNSRGLFSKLHQVSTDGQSWQPATNLAGMFSATKSSQTTPVETTSVSTEAVEWFYANGEQKLGPYTQSQILDFVKTNTISPNTLLWRESLKDWTEARICFSDVFVSRRVGKAGRVPVWLMLAILLVLGGGGYGAWKYQLISVFKYKFGMPDTQGVITSVKLTDPKVNAAVTDAVGMVVTYLEITRKTGEYHECTVSTGSCFLVTREGQAITNRHVVEDHTEWLNASASGRIQRFVEHRKIPEETAASVLSRQEIRDENNRRKNIAENMIEKITPRLLVYFDGKPYNASTLHVSKKYDMAVIELTEFPQSKHYFSLSSTPEPPISTQVVSLGYPAVSQQAVSEEEIAHEIGRQGLQNPIEKYLGTRDHMSDFKSSAFKLVHTGGEVSVVQQESGKNEIIQHTAFVRQGNSGGPLVLREGSKAGVVVGVNTMVLRDASPVYVAFSVAQMRDELDKVFDKHKLTWR